MARLRHDLARYKVEVHIGPVRSDAADAFLERLRAYQGSIGAGGFLVGTQTLYFEVNGGDSQTGARILTYELLMSVFGAGTGLTRAVTRCERIDAGA